ncbi:hypothetical protein I4182_02540 [Klebsiella pneumoniae]|nr:hypothetical protein [Klebsiella pneumoniae]
MNLNTLNYLIKNAEEIIIESAEENGLNAENVLGVANQVVGEKSTQNLSGKQRFLFEKAILPLIENVPCIGWFDEFDGDDGSNFDCPNMIEERRLTHCYQEQNMLCESCEEEENYRAAKKSDYMRD